MFEPIEHPRVFGLPPGVDFPRALVDGLHAHLSGQAPDRLARVQLIVNTRRMARRIRDLFDRGPACLLPRIHLVTDLGEVWNMGQIPPPVSPLRKRLQLSQLISGLLAREPDLAPRSALFDLADSLAALMDEMQGEGVTPDVIRDLDISDQSGHWARIKAFLGIISDYYAANADEPDTEARQRLVIEGLTESWRISPPDHPVIVAGSTGSRGATQMLMQAVARLPQGAVILPGFDTHMPEAVWETLGDALRSEDHAQYRFHHFLSGLGLSASQVSPWQHSPPPNPARNKAVSLALRPAPVTDQWLSDGPGLGDLEAPFQDVTLVEAPSLRAEALVIAMRLRKAAETGQSAALITPDRMLTRQVAAALDRWNIIPDDSAGQPLHLSPPGRFLRHVAELFTQPLTAAALLTLLKHPLTHTGGARNLHLRLTRELELHLRRHGPPYPVAKDFAEWAQRRNEAEAEGWAAWVSACFCGHDPRQDLPLEQRVEAHIALAERIASGSLAKRENALWKESAGREALRAVQALQGEARFGGALNARDYFSLFHAILSREEVRNPDTPHPHILIWGTLEARVQGADLLILAGLNEGTWPSMPAPDPWLNRALRHQVGLLLPERRIGLSAHDFQQAIGAREVWLTRSIRSDDAETVASRWLNRLINLLRGLPDQNGCETLGEMRARGDHWLGLARALEQPGIIPPAQRPAPCPPPETRPKQLSVTAIKRLIRDPYAIYARYVLRLKPLDPLMQAPDALLRGIVLHKILEEFIRESVPAPEKCTKDALMAKATSMLGERVPWAEARATWLARLDRVADTFIANEMLRRDLATPTAFEKEGRATIPPLGFTLTAKADRVDLDADGAFYIYDYKTGAPPSPAEQRHYDKQLLLEVCIAERSGFGDLPPGAVADAVFISLAAGAKEVKAPLTEEPPAKVWKEFISLMTTYAERDTGYTARRAMHSKRDQSDYDQLARFGEWDITDAPKKCRLD